MANWSWSGILLVFAIFFVLVGVILTQINVENPLTGVESSVMEWLIDAVVDALNPFS